MSKRLELELEKRENGDNSREGGENLNANSVKFVAYSNAGILTLKRSG